MTLRSSFKHNGFDILYSAHVEKGQIHEDEYLPEDLGIEVEEVYYKPSWADEYKLALPYSERHKDYNRKPIFHELAERNFRRKFNQGLL